MSGIEYDEDEEGNPMNRGLDSDDFSANHSPSRNDPYDEDLEIWEYGQ